MKYYYEIMKELREDSDMTQTELGNILDLTQRQISTYEVGRSQPPYEILVKYAKYFNVSTDYILGLTKDPAPHWSSKSINNSFNNNSGSFGNITIK